MRELKFDELYMVAIDDSGKYNLKLYVSSGHMDYAATVELEKRDFEVLTKDSERAAFLLLITKSQELAFGAVVIRGCVGSAMRNSYHLKYQSVFEPKLI
ncbi:hypothetical protein K6Q96_07060 [Grimontia kaedaensis]|uniref:Uncharacterized protein n=1 Tax=Grimontia kaedaensis TaxID=2872157 RepID=A0ABY4WXN4_9GAMM|nr:hypothetical protein [Grimontia kaedaensis]USH03744.1 hypothetical protein K6Q96_07060 [Grimontia kaedaensis]